MRNLAILLKNNLEPERKVRDTFNHLQLSGNYSWNLAVPNGTYKVRIVAGDPKFFDSTYKIDANGYRARPVAATRRNNSRGEAAVGHAVSDFGVNPVVSRTYTLRPNIIYFVCHDLGKHLSCYDALVESPHLDRFAAEGVKFTRAFCASPACSPSRACVMTGKYAHTTGAIGLAHMGWNLSQKEQTLVDYFNAAGYQNEYWQRPLPRCAEIVETTLTLQNPSGSFGGFPPGFIDLDGVYALSRASRVAQHKRPAAHAAIRRVAAFTQRFLQDDAQRARVFADTHQALGTASCLAALQEALPDELPSRRPLHLVLNRVPFV